ncbi:G2/mitotic-specific cyclin-B-like [Oscarella lobularis]|uniref:G2/mitotic-specific cyclin-B-like n=1 Tax=Oscarella lobularis TaxID=121494 RepID=UPI003313F282
MLRRQALGEIRNRTIQPGRGFGKAHIRSLQPISKPQSVFKEEADEEEMETSRSHEEPMEMETAIPPLYENIDEDDADNPQLCSEYVNDIYKYMRELEVKYTVPSTYMTSQRDINAKMRAILVDWLIQVHQRFHLLPETLYTAISLLDRYLAVQAVPRNRLQLVGVTAMLVASKYEEIYAPELRDFVFIADNAYTAAQIRATERTMLRVLKFELGKPLPLHFLRRNSKAGQVDAEIHTVAKFLLELSLPDYSMLAFKPSQIAASALYISLIVNNSTIGWNPTLIHYSTYNKKEIQPCVRRLCELVKESETSKLQAVRKKYSSPKFLSVAEKPMLKGSFIMSIAY